MLIFYAIGVKGVNFMGCISCMHPFDRRHYTTTLTGTTLGYRKVTRANVAAGKLGRREFILIYTLAC